MTLMELLLQKYGEEGWSDQSPASHFAEFATGFLNSHPLLQAELHLDGPAVLRLSGPDGDYAIEMACAEERQAEDPVMDFLKKDSPGGRGRTEPHRDKPLDFMGG